MNEKLRKAVTKEKTDNLRDSILNDLLIGMVNKPFLICLFGFCIKDVKLKL